MAVLFGCSIQLNSTSVTANCVHVFILRPVSLNIKRKYYYMCILFLNSFYELGRKSKLPEAGLEHSEILPPHLAKTGTMVW